VVLRQAVLKCRADVMLGTFEKTQRELRRDVMTDMRLAAFGQTHVLYACIETCAAVGGDLAALGHVELGRSRL